MADLSPSGRPAKKQRLSGEYGTATHDQTPGDSSPRAAASRPRALLLRPGGPESPEKRGGPIIPAPRPPPPSSPSQWQQARIHTACHAPAASSEPPTLQHESSSVAFDPEMFESFVGHKVEPDVLDLIRQHSNGNLERAVNMASSAASAPAALERGRSAAAALPESNGLPSRSRQRQRQPRYIGAFGVEGWATRSGHNMLRHGDAVKIERQKIQAPQTTPKGQIKIGVPIVTARMTAAAARRVDVIVRFTNAAGAELGRLSKETANWVSTLMDQGICRFEGACVYAPERMRTNDTIFLQLRVYLLPSAFQATVLHPSDDIATSFREEDETTQEKDLRLRQVALVRLFQEINVLPSTLSAQDTKQQRQGLLEAAELDEKGQGSPKGQQCQC
ncbi:unnamed protein product [Parascedosporium putredinis]|uniref:HIRAN domain-containing protein n=1 Tax=Parascedosporium putredinis TaxID=1442378 RepID=A0A9P1MD33_9PEZI|nr:unnamed protein product [Parascedosporium putredinis]CAI8002854.1 unnamed protein product [Parascedosporium putredinis]